MHAMSSSYAKESATAMESARAASPVSATCGEAFASAATPAVSVIVPAYNAASTIERCLDSLTAQTLSAIEVIVVNDGSTDDTAAIVSAYAERDGRIRLIDQENSGSGAARNVGINRARGRYLAFIDSDDTIEPDMLQTMVAAAEVHDAAIAVCQADNLLYENGAFVRSLGSFTLPAGDDVVSGAEAASWLLDFIAPNMNSMCFKLVARTLIEESGVRFPEHKRYVEDMPMSAGLLLNADHVALVRRDLYHYIHEGETRSTLYTPRTATDIILNLRDIRAHAERASYTGSLDNFTLGMCFSAEKHLAWADAQAEGRDEALALIAEEKAGHTPDFSKPIPLAQKAKILCAYRGATPVVCGIVDKFKWIPFVRYLV